MKWYYFLLPVMLVAACTESRSAKSGGANVEATDTTSFTRQTKQIDVPTWYYAHFGADYTLEVPAEGFGGWEKTVLPLCPEHTALCVMHAWDNPDQDLFPGIYSAVEYLPRAAEIFKTRMPALLKTFRDAGIRVIHIESGEYVHKYEAYKRTQELIREQLTDCRKARNYAMPHPAPDPVYQALHKFRGDYVHPGTENKESIRGAVQVRDIHESVKPLPGEYMLTDSDELQAVCALHDINHLIYAGFALNCCLLISPGGMIDMSRRGFICSTVREVTTAVENDFSARDELAKQLALWYTALFFGFVYEQADLEKALEN
jgi:nicotinamidase-related amidase